LVNNPVYGEATGLGLEGKDRVVLMKDGSNAVASAVVIATGVSYRRLGVPAVENLVGAGVFHGTALTEAPVLRGEDVVVVGAGNSAGQAAVRLAGFARSGPRGVRSRSHSPSWALATSRWTCVSCGRLQSGCGGAGRGSGG
jgi:thioredoxin reductase (NADPH)